MSTRLLDGVRFAIGLEDAGLKFYRRVLEEVRNEHVQVLFKFLVEAETSHKEALQAVEKGLIEEDPALIQKAAKQFNQLHLEVPIFKEKDVRFVKEHKHSVMKMFNKSMDLEKEGMAFYQGLSIKEQDPLLKAFWTKLAKEELIHKQEIERLGFSVLGVVSFDIA
ncbi:TPA: hypothetical protein HA265_04510 [Candidatus Woesearchaeota archaeon]|nr:hypothetical protein [Candidatus Woesearchaeota archaeon]